MKFAWRPRLQTFNYPTVGSPPCSGAWHAALTMHDHWHIISYHTMMVPQCACACAHPGGRVCMSICSRQLKASDEHVPILVHQNLPLPPFYPTFPYGSMRPVAQRAHCSCPAGPDLQDTHQMGPVCARKELLLSHQLIHTCLHGQCLSSTDLQVEAWGQTTQVHLVIEKSHSCHLRCPRFIHTVGLMMTCRRSESSCCG